MYLENLQASKKEIEILWFTINIETSYNNGLISKMIRLQNFT